MPYLCSVINDGFIPYDVLYTGYIIVGTYTATSSRHLFLGYPEPNVGAYRCCLTLHAVTTALYYDSLTFLLGLVEEREVCAFGWGWGSEIAR